MTQSAMSRLVKNLEDELGVTLLYRKGKAAVPTPEGRLFYEHAKRILDEYSQMKQDISMATQAAKSTLRLGGSALPAAYLLPQVIYDFSRAHPDISIDLAVYKTSDVFRDLRDGKIDVGIVEGTSIDDAFSAVTIAEDEVVIIASENHHLAKKKKITLQDLAAEPFILPELGSQTRVLADAFFREAGLDAKHLKIRMTLESPELIVQMVQAGLGIAFASKWSVLTAVKEGTVKLLRVSGGKMMRSIYLVSIIREMTPNAVKIFSEFIKGHRFVMPF